jgi:hypothetical protein
MTSPLENGEMDLAEHCSTPRPTQDRAEPSQYFLLESFDIHFDDGWTRRLSAKSDLVPSHDSYI